MPARYPIDRWTRRKALAVRASLAVSLLAIAAPVISGTAVSLTGTVTSTGISGFSVTAFTLGHPEGRHAVCELWSVERNDKPCHIATMTDRFS